MNYISSEQLIQANKAKFFGNLETYNQILCCSTSLECKNLSKLIRNVDESKWEEEAGNICLPGIRTKFYQNPVAMDTLLYKTEQMMCDKLHNSLATIMQGETEEEKLDSAKQIVIKNCRRLGRFSRNRPCPVSVELLHKQDVKFILDNRFDLPQGTYVDKEYPIDIERKRKTLLPVLCAAK